MLCALVNSGAVVEYRELAEIPTLAAKPHLKWLPVETDEPSALGVFEVLSNPVVTVLEDRVIRAFSAQPMPKAARDNLLDRERDRRIVGGYTFGGVRYQTREEDRENLAGAATLALGAMMAGAQPGNLRWHGGPTDFAWIAENNSANPMDAQTMFAFASAVAQYKAALIFACRALKDLETPPEFYTADIYWPADHN